MILPPFLALMFAATPASSALVATPAAPASIAPASTDTVARPAPANVPAAAASASPRTWPDISAAALMAPPATVAKPELATTAAKPVAHGVAVPAASSSVAAHPATKAVPEAVQESPANVESTSPKQPAAKVAAASEPMANEHPEHESEPLPKNLPPYGAERALPAIRRVERKFANGLTVWVLPRTDGPPKVHFVLAIRGGLAADPDLQPGFSTLLAGLLKEGTASRDALRIAQDVQSYGGDLQAEAGADGITLTMSALASNAAKAITLLSEVALQPAFTEREVEIGKLNAVQALKASEADPDYLARRAIGRLLFGRHAYGHLLPSGASLVSITPEQLREEHALRFRPDRALLVIAGRIEPDAAFVLAERVFGEWHSQGQALAETLPVAQSAPGRVFVQRDDSVQSAIRIGRTAIAADSPDYFPLQMANALLGGGFTSRINQNLREDKGWTYYAGSAVGAERAGGAAVAATSVRNAVTGAAVAQILREYARLGEKPVPADELEMTQRYLAGGFALMNQQQSQVASTLADFWLVGLPPQTLTDYVTRLRAVTAQQVREMARKYYAPKEQSIVVVGDASVLPQLKPWGEFEQQTP